MDNIFYDVQIFLPEVLMKENSLERIEEYTEKYAIIEKDIFSCTLYHACVDSEDILADVASYGYSCNASISPNKILEYLLGLPDDVVVNMIECGNKIKSNGRMQTDEYGYCAVRRQYIDLPAPHIKLESEQDEKSTGTTLDKSTQTDFANFVPLEKFDVDYAARAYASECGEYAGSELASEFACKWDTEYSLQMWNNYRVDTIIYLNPYTYGDEYRTRHAPCVKLELSLFEFEIQTICQRYEKNIMPYVL